MAYQNHLNRSLREKCQRNSGGRYTSIPTGEYLLVVIDRYSRFPEVEKTHSTKAVAVILKLDKIFAVYGIPDFIKSDNEAPFSKEDYERYVKLLGIKQNSAHHIGLKATHKPNASCSHLEKRKEPPHWKDGLGNKSLVDFCYSIEQHRIVQQAYLLPNYFSTGQLKARYPSLRQNTLWIDIKKLVQMKRPNKYATSDM